MRWLLLAALVSLPRVSEAGDGTRYPDDAFSRPVSDHVTAFETGSGLMLAPGIVERARFFVRNELRLVPTDAGRARTEWRFRRLPSAVSETYIAIDERVRRAPEAVSMRITNDSAHDVSFVLHARELPWEPVAENRAQTWCIGEAQTVPAGETQYLRFDASRPRSVEPDAPRKTVLYPLSALYLVPTAIKDGVPYRFLLEELTVHYSPPTAVTLTRLEAMAPEVEAGSPVLIGLGMLASEGLEKTTLEVRRGDRTLWRIRLTEVERTYLAEHRDCTLTRGVPWYLPDGPYVIGAVYDGCRLASPEAELYIRNGRHPELPRVARRMHLGRPVVTVDGKPFPWVGYSSYDYQPGNVSRFADGQLSVVCVPVAAGRHVHHHAAATTVPYPDVFDFAELDERVAFSLQSQPDAHVMLRVSLAPPHFWMQDHPEALARVRTGEGDLVHEETGSCQVSMMGTDWREYQATLLRALLAHCKAQPWAGRLIGAWLTGGVTEEWFAWGCNDGFAADYSAPNEAAFAAWCAERGYPWRTIPNPAERSRPGHDLYPPDDAGKAAAAYAQFASDSTADTIAYFARAVKEASNERLMVGSFYGYVIQLAGETRQHFGGHFALRWLLDCPDVDFIGGIPLLDYRRLIDGFDAFVTAEESVAAAGKLFCSDNDLFSWLHPLLWYQPYDPADPRGAAIAMHRRVAANDLVHGAQRQWFGLMASWHDDDALQHEFARQRGYADTALTLDRAPTEEIAFVVDDTSFAWTPPESTLLRHTNKALLRAAGTLGAPIRVWLLSDVDRLPTRIRFVVVADARAAAPEDIRKLGGLIEAGGLTMVVVGTPGLVDPVTQTWDTEAPSRLLGLPVVVDTEGGPAGVTPALDEGPAQVRPRAYAREGDAVRYTDGKSALLERELAAGGRLLWCGVPPVSRALLRGWMEDAGVFFHAPAGCQVNASRELVSVTSPAAESVALRWRDAVTVRDLYDGWTAVGETFDCPFAAGQTRLFSVHAVRSSRQAYFTTPAE